MNKKKRGFTSRRHPEPALLPLRAALKGCYSGSNKTISGSSRIFNKGFTLLEVLVVVIIIAVLAAVAVPMYKHAVLKSRFSAVMPMAKSVADAQEVYYLGNGQYATHKSVLDVTPVSAENTTVELSGEAQNADDEYAYVVASRSDVPGARYIQYQKNSPQFAENIHCEALDADSDATWLCKEGLRGTPISIGEVKSLSGDEYTTYLLYGSITGSTFDRQCQGSAPTEQGETCPSGCGKKTATSSCDPHTGQWGEPEYNEDSCPSPLPDETKACANGSGMMVRHSQCKADGSGYEYGAWDESACCEGEKPTTAFQSGKVSGQGNSGTSYSGSISAGDWKCVGGQWQYGSFNSTLQLSGNSISCSDFYTGGDSNAPNGGACTGTYLNGARCEGTYSYGCSNSTFTGGQNNAVCQVSSRYPDKAAYACGYSTFNNKSFCDAYLANGCYGSTFNNGSACLAKVAGGCNGAILKAGSYCSATSRGDCSGAIFEAGTQCWTDHKGGCDGVTFVEGSCCRGSSYINVDAWSEVCPAGVPICAS